jgi:glutamine amidotransferase
MIGIIDYGLGNIHAIVNIYKKLNLDAMPVKNTDELRAAEKLILPGVGSFDSVSYTHLTLPTKLL